MLSIFNKVKYINVTPFHWTNSIVLSKNMSTAETNEKVEVNRQKRERAEETSELDGEALSKKPLLDKPERVKKRKVAMMISYLGQGYLGLQRNPGTKTVEEDLLVAMLKAGLINEEAFNQPQVIQFQRAARTDKGVSAIRQILSLKLPEHSSTEAINEHLPSVVRAIAIKRVTKGFNCKSHCDARTYSYMTPTFAFARAATENYRLTPDVRDHVGEIIRMYEGTHNFHNFTAKKMPTDPSSTRYIMSFTCGEPFLKDDLEFVTLRVKGQSFMLHQIRKMVGLAIAIVRGLTTVDSMTSAWEREKVDIPIAPGLGLLLEEVHYDRYNMRYGNDGMHEPLEWSQWDKEVEQFKQKHIIPTIVEVEKKEKSMMSWLEMLSLHTFDVRTEHIHSSLEKALEKNKDLLAPPMKEDTLKGIEDVAC